MRPLLPLALLALALPFEPMEPVLRPPGFEMSLLEVMAALFALMSAGALLASGPPVPRSIPLALPALGLVVVCIASTWWAEPPRILPFKFTLRMAAGVVVFFLVSMSLARDRRYGLLFACLAAAGAITATLAVLEAAPFVAVDGLLEPFREHRFEVGGRPRVTATFTYPNAAAGFVVLCLPAALGLAARSRARIPSVLASSTAVLMVAAILFTYSRGALLGGVTASLFFLVALGRSGRRLEARRLLWLHGAFVLVTVAFALSEPAFRWRVSSEGDREWYRARIVPEEEVLRLDPGELTRTPVLVENTGRLTWDGTRPKPIQLGYRWFTRDGEGAIDPLPLEGDRTPLPVAVEPEGRLELDAVVRAPEEPGRYLLAWDMVHEHTTWFSDKVGFGVPVEVVVGDPDARLAPAPEPPETAPWRPGRLELWRIALALFFERPVLGVGPDNFRWVYGEAAGRERWDTRVFANSLYLELLATTGALGAVMFLSAVGLAFVGLGRVASRDERFVWALVLRASLLGFLVHGLVDYVLEATPLYLGFWILLGASSAVLREDVEGAST